VNLSLYYPRTLLPNTERRRLKLELGLLSSRVGAIRGFGASLWQLRTEFASSGVTFALAWNRAGALRGVQSATFYTEGYGKLRGVGFSGIVHRREGSIEGLELAGIYGRSENVLGAQTTGLVAIAQSMDGMQLSGILARSAGWTRGFQLAGIAAISGDVTGAQIGGLVAAGQRVEGVQVGGITSLAENVDGLQVGFVSVARKVRGLQIGFVNVADEVEGGAIGLVSIARNGSVQPLAWISGGVETAANLGVKFVTGYTYSYFGGGHDFAGNGYRIEAGAGGHFPFAGSFFAEAGLAYVHKRESGPLDLDPVRQELRYDARLGVELGLVSPFVGGGLAQRIAGEGTDFRGEFSAGVAVF
jgi:hypothetical protein